MIPSVYLAHRQLHKHSRIGGKGQVGRAVKNHYVIPGKWNRTYLFTVMLPRVGLGRKIRDLETRASNYTALAVSEAIRNTNLYKIIFMILPKLSFFIASKDTARKGDA
jgi:hypothetical protein